MNNEPWNQKWYVIEKVANYTSSLFSVQMKLNSNDTKLDTYFAMKHPAQPYGIYVLFNCGIIMNCVGIESERKKNM